MLTILKGGVSDSCAFSQHWHLKTDQVCEQQSILLFSSAPAFNTDATHVQGGISKAWLLRTLT
jgi:hypothetical protein